MLRLKIVDEKQEKIGFWRASVCLFSFGIFIIPTLFLLSHRQFQKLIEVLHTEDLFYDIGYGDQSINEEKLQDKAITSWSLES